eukprot:gene9675-10502_t
MTYKTFRRILQENQKEEESGVSSVDKEAQDENEKKEDGIQPLSIPQPTNQPTQIFVAPSVHVDTSENDNLIEEILSSAPTIQSIVKNKEIYNFNQELKNERTFAFDSDILIGIISVIASIAIVYIFIKKFCHLERKDSHHPNQPR